MKTRYSAPSHGCLHTNVLDIYDDIERMCVQRAKKLMRSEDVAGSSSQLSTFYLTLSYSLLQDRSLHLQFQLFAMLFLVMTHEKVRSAFPMQIYLLLKECTSGHNTYITEGMHLLHQERCLAVDIQET